MYFEGPEKKLEIVVDESVDLRGFDRGFWDLIVEKSRATIISDISSSHCQAYLLSESSLFVSKDRLTMITCGTTTLVKAAEHLIEKLGSEKILGLYYQRKNENFPHYQKTHFFEDIEILKKKLPARVYQFGEEDEHFMYLYHASKKDSIAKEDFTLEILMNGLTAESKENFFVNKMTEEFISKSGMREILPGYQIDDYVFEPCGYSLNALKDDKYFTIHVTPQDRGSYVSFETNGVRRGDAQACVERVLDIFKPRTFDVVLYDGGPESSVTMDFEKYVRRRSVRQPLVDGYLVQFFHFYEPSEEDILAYDITGRIL